jgi:hypothetical protein
MRKIKLIISLMLVIILTFVLSCQTTANSMVWHDSFDDDDLADWDIQGWYWEPGMSGEIQANGSCEVIDGEMVFTGEAQYLTHNNLSATYVIHESPKTTGTWSFDIYPAASDFPFISFVSDYIGGADIPYPDFDDYLFDYTYILEIKRFTYDPDGSWLPSKDLDGNPVTYDNKPGFYLKKHVGQGDHNNYFMESYEVDEIAEAWYHIDIVREIIDDKSTIQIRINNETVISTEDSLEIEQEKGTSESEFFFEFSSYGGGSTKSDSSTTSVVYISLSLIVLTYSRSLNRSKIHRI